MRKCGWCQGPFYVFPGKRWKDDLLDGSTPGSAGTMSESGWSNSAVFMDYLEKHFLRHVSTAHPLLVLFDGHKSHVNLTLADWGRKNNIIFFVLPPHTSHVTQPLDIGCFGPLKNTYYSECQAYMRLNPGMQLNRYNVAAISSRAYNKGFAPDNLISAFRKAGISPFDKTKITPLQTTPAKIYNSPETETHTQSDSFLVNKTITSVKLTTNKRKSPPAIHGNLMSPSKQPLLHDAPHTCVQTTPAKK